MEYISVLLPSAAVGAIFYFVMRAIFQADRAERQAQAAAEEEATQRSSHQTGTTPPHHVPAPETDTQTGEQAPGT